MNIKYFLSALLLIKSCLASAPEERYFNNDGLSGGYASVDHMLCTSQDSCLNDFEEVHLAVSSEAEKSAFITGGSPRDSLYVLPNDGENKVIDLDGEPVAFLIRGIVPGDITDSIKALTSFSSSQRTQASTKWRPDHKAYLDKFDEIHEHLVDSHVEGKAEWYFFDMNVRIKTKTYAPPPFSKGMIYQIYRNESGNIYSFSVHRVVESPELKQKNDSKNNRIISHFFNIQKDDRRVQTEVFYERERTNRRRISHAHVYAPTLNQISNKLNGKNKSQLENVFLWGNNYFSYLRDEVASLKDHSYEYMKVLNLLQAQKGDPVLSNEGLSRAPETISFNTLNVNLSYVGLPTTNYHYDQNVDPDCLALLFATGCMYTGGETVFPGMLTLEGKVFSIDLQQGDLLFFKSKKIFHGNMPVSVSDAAGMPEGFTVGEVLNMKSGDIYKEFRRSAVLYNNVRPVKKRVYLATKKRKRAVKKVGRAVVLKEASPAAMVLSDIGEEKVGRPTKRQRVLLWDDEGYVTSVEMEEVLECGYVPMGTRNP